MSQIENASKNNLYCITTKCGNADLKEKFNTWSSLFLEKGDGDCIGGYDIENESIIFSYIDERKIFKMIDFFEKHHLLIKYELVSDVIDLLYSDEKYLKFYSDERNKEMLDNYILHNVTIDNILDRLNKHKKKIGFSLLPIEMSILASPHEY